MELNPEEKSQPIERKFNFKGFTLSALGWFFGVLTLIAIFWPSLELGI